MDVLVIGSGIILGVLCALFLILLVNLLTFPRLKSYEPPGQTTVQDAPLLSILVPARNEERCIEVCVRSLVAQNYERLEVLVLDDHSSDATAAIVQRILDELPGEQKERLRLLSGAPLATGWVGKNFACHQLAQQARGDYLLFTDADTVHTPGMAGAVLATMREQHVALLTGQPEMVTGSLGERLIVPLLNFTILTLLPVALIPRRPETSLATGNGQLLCFQRATYEEIGGHAVLKERILEDVLLARAVKAAGRRIIFVDALLLVRCRMYASFAEVWAGFSKNLFAFYSYKLPFALVALLLNLALFVLPPLLLLAALLLTLPPLVISCALSAYLLAVLMRVLLSLRFTRRQRGVALLLCLLHPLSILLECLILVNSIRWHYRKAGTVWKGRHYT
jgi:chlorobactene glucosyltransferase